MFQFHVLMTVTDHAFSLEGEDLPTIQVNSRHTGNAYQTEHQGTVHYEAGEYEFAIANWQIALDGYQARGDALAYGRVKSLLALAYQQLGLWSEAHQALDDAFLALPEDIQANSEPHVLQVYAQLLNNQGGLQLAQGQADQALESWQQSDLENYNIDFADATPFPKSYVPDDSKFNLFSFL